MAVLITADAIVGKSTNDILEEFVAQVEDGAADDNAPVPFGIRDAEQRSPPVG